jgi:membrane fusion protein (multidrug efflux system)
MTRCFPAVVRMVLLPACLLLGACGRGSTPPKASDAADAIPVVGMTPAETRQVDRSIPLTGSLAGQEEISLSNRVTGVVESVLVDVGAVVVPDQPLANIDSQRYELLVKQAKAAQTQTLARLGLTDMPEANFDIDSVATVSKAMAELANAEAKYNRAVELYRQKIMTDFEYVDIVSSFQARKDALRVARDEAKAILQQVRQNQALVELQDKDLRDSIIKAPKALSITGTPIARYVVAQRMISPGEYLKEGATMFQLVAQDTLKLQARLPERFVTQIKNGQTVTFKTAAQPDKEYTGLVSRINPTVDALSRSFELEATVDNAAGQLRAGSFVEGTVITATGVPTVFVPMTAVVSYAGTSKVYVAEPQGADAWTVRMQDVTLGARQGTWVEILAGVKAKELTITSGQAKLSNGSKVRAPKKPSATAPATQP